MRKKVEEMDMVVDGMPVENEAVDGMPVENEAVVETATPVNNSVIAEVVPEAFTATKIIDHGLISYAVDSPVNGKAKLTITNRIEGIKITYKLIDLTESEFADEALLKTKLVK